MSFYYYDQHYGNADDYHHHNQQLEKTDLDWDFVIVIRLIVGHFHRSVPSPEIGIENSEDKNWRLSRGWTAKMYIFRIYILKRRWQCIYIECWKKKTREFKWWYKLWGGFSITENSQRAPQALLHCFPEMLTHRLQKIIGYISTKGILSNISSVNSK